MDKWEYLSLKVVWNGKEQKWEGWLGEKVMKAEKIYELFNPLGADGWEMVAFTPSFHSMENWQRIHHDLGANAMVTGWDTTIYRAMLKRKLP